MAFKKTENSRDSKSTNAGRRSSSTGSSSNTKKSFSSSRSKTDGPGFKKFDADGQGERKSFNKNFSKPNESFGGEKKYKGKPSADFKRPYGSNDTEPGKRKSYGANSAEPGKRKPYGTNNAEPGKRKPYGSKSFDDSPREGGFKRKPYGEKDFTDKPARGGFKSNEGFGDKPARGGFKSSEGFGGKGRANGPAKRFDKGAPKERSVRETFFDDEQPQTERTMRSRKKSTTQDPDKGKIRLNRYISNAGICSRRKADELIVAGVVSVNGEIVSELGFKVDPAKDEIRYNGETLKREKMVYVLLNKPKDYITTTDDPQERRTVMHLVEKASRERIYPVGRLDRNTTGLLLMTNDGDLADKLSHPRNSVTKLYQVELNKSLTQGDLNKIAYGIELEDGLIKPDAISYVSGGSKREIGIQIHSGKNRIVRRIFESLGYEVVKLDRSIYAGLTKKDLPRGRWRYLDETEIIQLKHLIK